MRQSGLKGATVPHPLYAVQRNNGSAVYKNEQTKFNPFNLLMTALGYGESIWTKVNLLSSTEAIPLITLTIILEEHIQTLCSLCELDKSSHEIDNRLSKLSKFYNEEELSIPISKRGVSLQEAFISRTTPQVLSETDFQNYYAHLSPEEIDDELTYWTPRTPSTTETVTMRKAEECTQASFPEDLGISEVAASIRHRQTVVAMEEDEEVNPHLKLPPNSPPRTTTITTNEIHAPINVRINLIRHKYATPTDLTTLQLFKSFALAAKKTDPTLMVLPIDSTKQNLSPLVSLKQIDTLTNNQLRLYFSSWFRDQPHSLRGFMHLNTVLDIETMQTKLPLAEWLATYQYAIALCRSQTEEMSIIGALCYGSLFIHRDSLLKSILELPEWIKLNQGRETPIIIDLIVKPFKSKEKSVDMIFVRSERSKREETTKFFLKLYDGTPKRYPRGDMFLFIPVTSKLEAEYTDAQRAKYLFNHQAYLGDEDCVAIFGLSDLDTKVILTDNKEVTIRTLLKSLPASKGMSRPRLFQVVDCIPAQNCVLVTFQRSDRPMVEGRQFDLEVELCDQLASEQESKLFIDEVQRLRFGHAYHKNRGKIIRVHNPSQTHVDFVQHADRLLSSPPKKRTSAALTQSSFQTTKSAVTTGNLSYRGMVQAQTTHTCSVAKPNGITTTTTTQTSQTVMAIIETRFQTIEEEQKALNHRLNNVEHRTTSTDENIRAMMDHWKITPATIKRKYIENFEVNENNSAAGNANLPTASEQGQGAKCF